MATYDNDLRLKEIATGDESGTWGASTNTNLELIGEAFSYGVQEMAADANETFTMLDATADDVRSFYLKITSAVSLTATREITLGPNTVSKVWMIENATTGGQIITIKQGSGATVNVPNGSKVMVVTDGAGAGAAVLNANPTEIGGTVTSVGGTGTVNGLTLTGTVTSSGNLTLGGTFSATVSEISDLTATAAELNYTDGVTSNIQTQLNAKGVGSVTSVGGTGTVQGLTLSGTVTSSGSLTLGGSLSDINLTSQVTGTLPVANGGTGVTSSTGTGSVVLSSAPTITSLALDGAYSEEVYALSGTALDPANGTLQTKTLAANTTFTESLTSGESMVLMLGAGASYTVTWPTITWVTSAGNVAPTLTANDTLVFWKISTTLYGAYVGSYA